MLPDDVARALLRDQWNVSHETLTRLEDYVSLLTQWQRRINLVSQHTLNDIWTRHILDSAQLVRLKPQARRWVDIGSGGGLPGLVIACFLAESEGGSITLVESNAKKAAFLRHVAHELALPAKVHAARIETALPTLDVPEVISARALASLTDLLGYTNLLLKKGAVGLFPKGRDYQAELTDAAKSWHFRTVLHPSMTDGAARIIEVSMEPASN